MSKEDWIWVALRIFGIYLIVLATISIPEIVNSGIMCRSLWHIHQVHDQRLDVSPSKMSEIIGKDGKSMTRKDISAISKLSEINVVYNDLLGNVIESSFATLISNSVKFVLFLACGLYLLRGGRFIFNLVKPDVPQIVKE
jgi:hypothetical protein